MITTALRDKASLVRQAWKLLEKTIIQMSSSSLQASVLREILFTPTLFLTPLVELINLSVDTQVAVSVVTQPL